MFLFSLSLHIIVCHNVYFFMSLGIFAQSETQHIQTTWFTISTQRFSYYACVAHIQNNELLCFCKIVQYLTARLLVFAKQTQKTYVNLYLTQQVHIDKIFLLYFSHSVHGFLWTASRVGFSNSQVWENGILWNYITSPLTKLERCQRQLWWAS